MRTSRCSSVLASLAGLCGAGRDDADDVMAFRIQLPCVGYHQDHRSFGNPGRSPAVLAAFKKIVLGHLERIVEDSHGHLETQTVFATVGGVLGRVPFEPTHL